MSRDELIELYRKHFLCLVMLDVQVVSFCVRSNQILSCS